jgi:uncharacterized membrane protein
MIRIETRVVINRPIDEVFEFVSDVENNPLWQSSTVEGKQTSFGSLAVGTTIMTISSYLGLRIKTVWEVIEYEPNNKYVAKSLSSSGQAKGMWSFEPVSNGTRVDLVAEMRFSGLLRIVEPVLKIIGQRETEKEFVALRELLESQS